MRGGGFVHSGGAGWRGGGFVDGGLAGAAVDTSARVGAADTTAVRESDMATVTGAMADFTDAPRITAALITPHPGASTAATHRGRTAAMDTSRAPTSTRSHTRARRTSRL